MKLCRLFIEFGVPPFEGELFLDASSSLSTVNMLIPFILLVSESLLREFLPFRALRSEHSLTLNEGRLFLLELLASSKLGRF